MYFWNIKAVRADLKSGRLTEAHVLPYFLLLELLWLLPLLITEEQNTWSRASTIFTIVLMLVQIWAAFKVNGAPGKDFLLRFIVLSWVLSVRFLLIVSAGILFLSFLFMAITKDDTIAIAILTMVLEIFYAWRIVKHMKDIAAPEGPA